MKLRHISRDSLKLSDFIDHDTPASGAFVLFSGEARDNNQGKGVEILDYEAHENMADQFLGEILEEARQKFSLQLAHCVHRVGPVPIGESAVIVVTAGGHREETYAANRYIIDRIKAEAPIWKKEFFQDGSSEWGR